MSSAMQGTTKAMKSMAKSMNLPRLNGIMMEFTKENEKLESQQEMIGDTLDDAMADDQDEEEEDKIVNQVLDEIGIDLTGNVPEAPQQQKVAAPVKSQAKTAMPTTTLPGSDDAAVNELEARLNNLKRS